MKRYVKPLAGSLLAVVAAVAIGACGSSTSSSSSSSSGRRDMPSTVGRIVRQHLRRHRQPAAGHRAPVAGPGAGLHDPGIRGQLARVHRPDQLRARQRHRRRAADPRPGHRSAGDHRRRQDLHGDAAQGPDLLQRQAGQGQRLRLHGRARDQDPVGRLRPFITPIIVGASAYSSGKAKSISGITTNDSTGKIVIHLTAPYGPFDNVLAFPALGIIPSGHADEGAADHPAPGRRPVHGHEHRAQPVVLRRPEPEVGVDEHPRHPRRSRQRRTSRSRRTSTPTRCRCSTTAPTSSTGRTRSRAACSARSSRRPRAGSRLVNLGGSTYYIFLNVTRTPFSSQLAREAVVTGLNQDAMSRLGSGTLRPGVLLPAAGRPGPPDLRRARTGRRVPATWPRPRPLVKQSGMAGQPVTVWSETRSPRQQWMTYYTQFLNSDRVQGDAEGDRRRDVLHDDRCSRSPCIRRPVSRTGTRTSPTRSTSTACCWTARRSCRPTTRTSGRSTTRTSTPRSRSWARPRRRS